MGDAGDRLRIAVVGASASGRGWAPVAHLPAIAAVDQFELVAVGASSPDSAAAAAEACGVSRGGGVAVAGLRGRHDPTLTHVKELVAGGWLGDVVSVNVTMLGSGALSHTSSEAWMAVRSNGANTMTIVGGHTLDAVEHCFGALVDVSAMVGVQVPQWHLADTGDIVDVDAPDTIVVNGTLASGGPVSYLAASVPHHGPGWRMEAYGTDGKPTEYGHFTQVEAGNGVTIDFATRATNRPVSISRSS